MRNAWLNRGLNLWRCRWGSCMGDSEVTSHFISPHVGPHLHVFCKWSRHICDISTPISLRKRPRPPPWIPDTVDKHRHCLAVACRTSTSVSPEKRRPQALLVLLAPCCVGSSMWLDCLAAQTPSWGNLRHFGFDCVYFFEKMPRILKASDAHQWAAAHTCIYKRQTATEQHFGTRSAVRRSGPTCSQGSGWWQTWNLILNTCKGNADGDKVGFWSFQRCDSDEPNLKQCGWFRFGAWLQPLLSSFSTF